LRNKYLGGSNELELPENYSKKNKIYMALPKSFYSEVQKKEEVVDDKGQRNIVRRFSPDYSRSNLALAIEEADNAE
jgi:hypothetical protein